MELIEQILANIDERISLASLGVNYSPEGIGKEPYKAKVDELRKLRADIEKLANETAGPVVVATCGGRSYGKKAALDLQQAALIYINTPLGVDEKQKRLDDISRRSEYAAYIAGAQWQKDHLWIDARKQHPKHCQNVFLVLVDFRQDTPVPQYYVGYWNEESKVWWGDGLGFADDAEITYWMPIPEIDITPIAETKTT